MRGTEYWAGYMLMEWEMPRRIRSVCVRLDSISGAGSANPDRLTCLSKVVQPLLGLVLLKDGVRSCCRNGMSRYDMFGRVLSRIRFPSGRRADGFHPRIFLEEPRGLCRCPDRRPPHIGPELIFSDKWNSALRGAVGVVQSFTLIIQTL